MKLLLPSRAIGISPDCGNAAYYMICDINGNSPDYTIYIAAGRNIDVFMRN